MAAQASGGARTSRPVAVPGRLNGHARPSPVQLYPVWETRRVAAPVPAWARLPRVLGRAAIWAVPGYAVAVLFASGRPGTPTTLAGVLGPLALLALAGVLAGGRGGRLALAGAAIGILGGFVVLLASGSPVGHPPQHALPLAGAILLAAGWLTVGAAVLRTRAHRIGDGLLLVACAVPLALGGFLLDGVPRLAALLLLAAGVGLCGSALDPRYRRRAAQ